MIKNDNIFSNLIWRFLERIGAQIISFVVTIVLARILEPDAYGSVALITVFTTILQVFVDGGFGNALIQKKDADDLDFSTVFYFNVALCLVLYGFMYVTAPLISRFYNNTDMTEMIRVACIIVVISGVKNVQQAYVSKNLLFKKFFFATLIGTVFSAFIGIGMAVSGFGAWALIMQIVANSLLDTVIVWIIVDWRPKKMFSFERLKILYSYGWKLLLSALIDTVYGNIRQLVIGKKYSPTDLAYYNRGQYMPNLIVLNINTSIDSVLFPVLSEYQDSREQIRKITKRAIKMSSYIMAPLMIGFAVVADSVVHIVLTDKWLPCVPYLRIFCLMYLFQPIHTANINVTKALGRSDIRLRQEIITKVIGLIALTVSMNYGVMAIAYTYLLCNYFNQIVNSMYSKKFIEYSYIRQLLDIIPNLLLAILMGGVVFLLSALNISVGYKLFIQLLGGATFYFFGSLIFKNDSFIYLLELIKKQVR